MSAETTAPTTVTPAFEIAEPVESPWTRIWENIKGGNLGSWPVIIALTMAVYLVISLITSLLMNWYNARLRLVER